MKKLLLILCIVIIFSSIVTAQVTDIDGNTYQTVQIGSQLWMSENLKVIHFSNGDTIPQETQTAFGPAWMYYGNNATNDVIYGKLYTGYTALDSRNICPTGWHVPNNSDWNTLISFLGQTDAGKKMKSNNAWDGTNESGFNGLPGGLIFGNNMFMLMGTHGYWWSSTEVGQFRQDFVNAESWIDELKGPHDEPKHLAMSIRCINDSTFSTTNVNEKNDVYQAIKIYPNPTKNFISISNIPSGVTLSIMDITGKLVYNEIIAQNQTIINTETWARGVYFIQFNHDIHFINKKIILSH